MDIHALKDKLLKGSLAGFLRIVLAIPLYLVLTPYTLSRLGTDLFGIWSFNTIIISLVNLTDFGFKNSLVRHVAANIDDEMEICRYFLATLWIYIILSIILLATIFLFTDDIVKHILHIPIKLQEEAIFVFIISAVSFIFRFISAPFQAVIEGYQEHFYSHLISLIWLVLHSIGSIVALIIKPDVYSLGLVSICSNILVFFLFIHRILKQFPFVLKQFTHIDPTYVISLLRFGVGIHLATLVITLREPVYKIMISRFCDLESLASFEVSYRLCTQLVAVVVSPLLGTFAVSALLERHPEELGKILRLMIGFNCTIFFPAVLFIGSFSHSLTSLWLGRDSNTTAFMIFVLFTGFSFYYMTEPLYKSLEGTGMSGYSALVQSIGMIISMAIFAGFSGQGDTVIPISLFTGFTVISISNYLMFRWRFKNMTLIAPFKLLLIIIPSALYAFLTIVVSSRWIPLIFATYLFSHFIVVAKTGVFNYFAIIGKILNMRLTRVRNTENVIKTH